MIDDANQIVACSYLSVPFRQPHMDKRSMVRSSER